MKLKSYLLYFGSKSKLTEKIISLMPPLNTIDTVISPFFGSGALEYYIIDNYSNIELYGYDIEAELVNYHKCLIENPEKLHDEIIKRFLLPLTKVEFLEYRKIITNTYIKEDNKYYMASILFGLSRNSYSGKLRSFAKKPRILNIDKMKDFTFDAEHQGKIHINIKNCFDVLSDENIQNNPNMLIYLDPPYYIDVNPRLNHYGLVVLQPPFDHVRLYNMLCKIKTKWILSYNGTKYITDLYKNFKMYNENVVYLRYTNDKTFSDKFKEIIITNY